MADRSGWMLYGAYGYTGRLIARVAAERGLRPLLAGRDPARTAAVARDLGLDHRAVALDDERALTEALGGVAAVVHAAGPFSRTYRPVVEACLATGAHYLDITGEISVLEAIHGMDGRARDAGVVLIPGVGFDVVPTDAVAVRAAKAVPNATHLDLAFAATGRPSAGSMRGMVEALGRPGLVREGGRIVEVPLGSVRRTIPFSDGPRDAVAIPWGDVSTAWHSTGVPNIRVFTPLGRVQSGLLPLARGLGRVGWVRAAADSVLHRSGGGPGERELAEGRCRIWAEAWNEAGTRHVEELMTPNGYTFTADSTVAAVQAVLDPAYAGPPAGALTPSRAFGESFVDGLAGVTRTPSEAP